MYYRPLLSNGKSVNLSWPLRVFSLMNSICWPLEDNANSFARFVDRFYYVFGFFIFLQHNDAELRYLRFNFHNLDNLLTGVPTYLVLIETHLRAFQMGLVKEKSKMLMKKFYKDIYIQKAENPQLFRYIHQKLRPTRVNSSLYIIALSFFFLIPILNYIYKRYDTLYKMIFPFDYTPNYLYYPLMLSQIWVGLIVTALVIGEANLIGEMILHLHGRFVMLREDLEQSSQKLLQRTDATFMARDLQYILKGIIERNVELYKFAAQFQVEFSYRIFVWFGISALLICGLTYKVFTNPGESISFVVWTMAKILEMAAVGELGSTLAQTTDAVSSMYYNCNWELVIERSTNTQENIRLMKLILRAMETSHKPIYLSGFNFFYVSLSTVVAVLRGAVSYYTFLISLR